MEQHSVPQMYLKRFTYDESNHCYTLNGNNGIHSQQIKEICKKNNLYELRNKNGDIVCRNYFEREIFGKIENEYTPFFDELFENASRGQMMSGFLEKGNNRYRLVKFIVMLILRNQTSIDQAYNVGLDLGMLWSPQQARNNAILNNFKMLEPISVRWSDEYNVIVHINNTNVPFVTANFPLIFLPPISDEWQRIWFLPISPRIGITLEPIKWLMVKRDKEVECSAIFVDLVNQYYSEYVDILLISSEKKVLEEIQRKRMKSKG